MQRILHAGVPGIYPPTGDYAHALELRGAGRLLLVSGTMGLEPDGTAPAGLDAQLARAWENVRAILGAAGMSLEDLVRVTSYLTDAAHAGANAAARVAALGGRVVPTTAIVVGTLERDWLVELEVLAAAP